jgi:hypothetical protein
MYQRLFVLCLSLCLFLSACKPQVPSFVPVTGVKSNPVPMQVETVRSSVLKYVTSSERLAALPGDAEWQMEERSEKEYRFRSGDWLIVIWPADADDGNQRIVILNEVEKAAWTGYINADGRVVDTYYAR